MKLTIPITPELRVRLLYAENIEIEVPDTAAPKGWQVVQCEPFAWSYEWASCITTDGPQNFKAVIEREAPPQWAIDDGQARKIVPLYTATQTVPEGGDV